MLCAAAVVSGGTDGGEGGARPKRGRAAGEVHAVQDPNSNQVLITTASEWGVHSVCSKGLTLMGRSACIASHFDLASNAVS